MLKTTAHGLPFVPAQEHDTITTARVAKIACRFVFFGHRAALELEPPIRPQEAFVPYLLLSGVVGLIVFTVSMVRVFSKSGKPGTGDYVTQNVLTRINAEYRELH